MTFKSFTVSDMPMIEKDIIKYVSEELDKIEEDFDVTVLCAVESGSRAWGFANEDSDYDVRFIYRRNHDYYLTLNKKRDVIDNHDLKGREYKYDLDFSGWDIKKALYLHYKSNPNLREWIKSPITYRFDIYSSFSGLPDFDKTVLKNHYGSITRNNWKKYVLNTNTWDMSPRITKQYLYCIRCILSWILITYENIDAPINIYELLSFFDKTDIYADYEFGTDLFQNIYDLIIYYKSGCSADYQLFEYQINNLSDFIDHYINIMKINKFESERPNRDIELYNKKFREIIK